MAIVLYCIDIVAIGNKYDDDDGGGGTENYLHFYRTDYNLGCSGVRTRGTPPSPTFYMEGMRPPLLYTQSIMLMRAARLYKSCRTCCKFYCSCELAFSCKF